MERTKTQINNDIIRCNSRLNTLRGELNKLQNSLNNAKKLLDALKNCVNFLLQTKDGFARNFSINNKPVGGKSFDEVKDNLQDSIRELSNIVIPNLNKEISKNNLEIRQLNNKLQSLRDELRRANQS